MDTAAIERELIKRITQSRDWLQCRRPAILESLVIREADRYAKEASSLLDQAKSRVEQLIEEAAQA